MLQAQSGKVYSLKYLASLLAWLLPEACRAHSCVPSYTQLFVAGPCSGSLKQCVQDYEQRLEPFPAELQALPVPTPADRDVLQVTVIAQESLQQAVPSKSLLRQAPSAAKSFVALCIMTSLGLQSLTGDPEKVR